MMKRSGLWTLILGMAPAAALAQQAPVAQERVQAPAQAAPVPPAPPTLPAVLTPVPGGMTVEQVAERAIRAAAQVRAAAANVDAADAARSEAGLAMIPGVTLQARYTRLSSITPPQLNFGSAAAFCVSPQTAALYAGTSMNGQTVCLNPRDSVAPPSTGNAGFSFPVILDQFVVRGTLTVPITDIPFRLARMYEAAGRTQEARRFDAEATRAQAAADGRVAFYEYMRSQGQLAIAEQAVETVRRHREDLARFVEAGTVARVELLRVEAQVAETERMAVMAREGLGVAEANLRIRILQQPGERVTLGEALDAPIERLPGNVQELIDQAWRSRPELASLERQVSAIDANLAAVRAGYFPSLVGQANLDIANPNQRFVPNSQEFNTTWDASLILQWSPTAAIQNGATASRVAAQREAVRAQIGALLAGVELDVRGAWVNVQGARAAIDAAGRQLAAAEEAYRVRRERFAAGSAISSDLTDAENDLLRARFALVNAHVDLRVSLARLRRAVGTPERTR
jgi:outer membrane protein